MFKSFLEKADKLCCAYFGLQQEEVRPNTVEVVNGNVVVKTTESNKRHLHVRRWKNFTAHDFEKISGESREKLGIAAGKAIAEKLIISFEDVNLENKK